MRRQTQADIYSKGAEIPYLKLEAAARGLVCSLMERQDRLNEEIFYKLDDPAFRVENLEEDRPAAESTTRGHSMTRGRRPVNAMVEAVEIANRRGSVEQLTGKRDCAFDFIIIEPYRNVFVKVKRSQTSFTYPLEILHSLPAQIASLHRVALTHVTAREFWVWFSKGHGSSSWSGMIPSWKSVPMACISPVKPFP